MLAQTSAAHVFASPRNPRRGRPLSRAQLGRLLILVAVSLVATALTSIDTLAAAGLWGSVRALALVGVAEMTLLLVAIVVVRRLGAGPLR
jgi:hypothetical protein